MADVEPVEIPDGDDTAHRRGGERLATALNAH